MNTKEFAELRSKAGWTQSQVAAALGLSLRTISAWESSDPPKPLAPPDTQSIIGLFRSPILEQPLKKMTQQAFDTIPSEAVAIWLLNTSRRECLLLPEAVRMHDFDRPGEARNDPSPMCVQPLLPPSLTTCPLLDTIPINLAGDKILDHPAKRYKTNRNNSVFKDGVCESLLHVPAFTPSAAGPQPVLLLSLENKLNEDGTVRKPDDGDTSLYDSQDVEVARKLADEFKERLIPDMRLLEMID